MASSRLITWTILLSLKSNVDGSLIDVRFSTNSQYHDYEILINGEEWFSQNITSNLNTVFIRNNHKTFSTKTQTLTAKKDTLEPFSGEDSLGHYDSYPVYWEPEGLGFETSLRKYQDQPIIVFSQRFKVNQFSAIKYVACV